MPSTPLQRPLLSVPCPDILTIEQAQAGGGLVAIMAVWNDAQEARNLAHSNRSAADFARRQAEMYDATAATFETIARMLDENHPEAARALWLEYTQS